MITALLILLFIGVVSFSLILGFKETVSRWGFNIGLKVLTRVVKLRGLHKKFTGSKIRTKLPSDTDFGFASPTPECVALDMMFKSLQSFVNSVSRFKAFFSLQPLAYSYEPKDNFRAAMLSSPDCIDYYEVVHDNVAVDSNEVVIYFHGGGHVMGAPSFYIQSLVELSKRTKMKVIAPDYTLCPEVTLQQQLNQCVEVVEHFQNNGKSTFLVGDSAGGGLVVGILQQMNATRNATIPICAVAMSPYLHKAPGSESRRLNGKTDYVLSEQILVESEELICSNGEDPESEEISWHTKSCRRFPPIMITASETELLYSDSVALCRSCKRDGVDVTFESAPYGIHIYPIFFRYAPEYEQAFERICNFINENAI